jgi:acyl-CoA reductase-like NAD-dependent aldehyde dehydrogenase
MAEFDTTLPPLTDLVDGELIPTATDDSAGVEDPNTGQLLQPMGITADDTLEAALVAADRVHRDGSWSGLSPDERATWLERLADAVEERAAESARREALTTGVTITMTSMLSFITHAAFRLAAAQLRNGWGQQVMDGDAGNPVEVIRRPWGPAVLLVPWNAPAPMAAHKAASALAAGAPAILKPSEFAPNGTGVIAEAADAIGLPAGVLQLVHGGPRVGGQLVTDPRTRAVSFTGGLTGGRAIAAACAPEFKPAQLELGGNNAVIVLDDADLDDAALGVQMLLTQLNGQWCRALGRLIVHQSVADDLLERVGARLSELAIGHSLDPASQMGPMVHADHLAMLQDRIAELEKAGGIVHQWSPLPDLPGTFLAPTLVTGVDSDDALHEIFGPIGTVHTFATDAEALALANATPYGLEGYVFGGDTDRAMAVARDVQAGGVKVNGATVMSLSLMAPRPAWGLSGFAEEGTVETIDFFAGHRVVGVEGMTPPAA